MSKAIVADDFEGPLTPVAPDAIRARKRPLAVLFVFAAELLWALVIATPVHAWAHRAWGQHPSGDGALFLPGGRYLLAWLGQNDAGLAVTARTTMVLLFVGAVVLQIPLGALIASLAFAREPPAEYPDRRRRSPRIVSTLRLAVTAFLPLTALLTLASLTAILLLAAGALAGSGLDNALIDRIGDARAFDARLVVYALFAALAALVGVVTDLARAAIGREVGLTEGARSPGFSVMLRGVRAALVVARRGLARAALAWAWRGAIGLVLIAAGYATAHQLGGRGGAALIALAVVHQAIVLARTALRASWLARAVALVAPVQDAARADLPSEGSAATERT